MFYSKFYSKLRASFLTASLLLFVPPVVLTPPVVVAQQNIRAQRVQFKPGATSATIESSIKGYEIVDYILNARKGQTMNVSMATKNGANYFNILAPGENEVAMFNGSTRGNQYEGPLPKSGDYKIRVYMMRSAARRNEVANYRLEMIVSGAGSSSGGITSGGGQTRKDVFESVCGVIVHSTNYRYRCKVEDLYSGGRKTQTVLYYPDQTIRLVWKAGDRVELNFEGMVPKEARYSSSEGETDFYFEDKTYFYISNKDAARREVESFRN
jgi:hypothetical protein